MLLSIAWDTFYKRVIACTSRNGRGNVKLNEVVIRTIVKLVEIEMLKFGCD